MRAATGVSEGGAVEGRDIGGAEVLEGEDEDGILLGFFGGGLAEALGEHGEEAGGALLLFGDGGRREDGSGIAGDNAGFKLQRFHDGLEGFADFGGAGVTFGGRFFKAAEDDGAELGRNAVEGRRVDELDRADGLELVAVGTGEGMAAAGKLVEDDAEGPEVGLDGALAGNELLGGHVSDSAAAGGIGGNGVSGLPARGFGGVELGFFGRETAGEAEVEDLGEAAVGEHNVGGLKVAMEDAERVGGGESVGDLDADGQDELEAGWPFGDELVKRLAGDVLHDDEGFFAFFADLIDGANVGVLDGRGHAGFTQNRGAHLLEGEGAALKDFKDDGAHELGVVGKVDDAGAAGAELAVQLVVGDGALHGYGVSVAEADVGKLCYLYFLNGE